MGPVAAQAIPQLDHALRDTESKGFALVHYVCRPGDDAAKALGDIGLAAVSTLLKALDDPNPVVRARAAQQLGRIPDAAEQTIGPLMGRLADESANVQKAAIRALGTLGKKASAAAPRLIPFLFTSPADASVVETDEANAYQLCSEAAEALEDMDMVESQVVPVLLSELQRGDMINPQAIPIIGKYPSRSTELLLLLRTQLMQKKVEAACALAALGENDADIQAVIASNLLFNGQVSGLAGIGLCELLAHGHTLSEQAKERLLECSKAEVVPHPIYAALLFCRPDDQATWDSYLRVMQDRHLFVSGFEVAYSERAVQNLIGHASIRSALLAALKDDRSLLGTCFLAPRVLIANGQHLDEAFACLESVFDRNQSSDFGDLADFLGRQPRSVQATSLLKILVSCHEGYIVHGDLYGNGGEFRVVGDRAAMALARHGSHRALTACLEDPDPQVRLRAVKALRYCGPEAVSDQLLAMATDINADVRRQVVRTLGFLASENPTLTDRVKPVLVTALKDRRRCVSGEAERALQVR